MKKSILKVLVISLVICMALSACSLQGAFLPSTPADDILLMDIEIADMTTDNYKRSVPYNQEKFPSIIFDEATIEAQALALSDQLITRVISHVPMEDMPTERELYDFVVSTALYDGLDIYLNKYPKHPYVELFDISEEGGLYASCLKADTRRMVYEVFGIWNLGKYEDTSITVNDDYKNIYDIALEQGFNDTPYGYENPTVSIHDNGTVVVRFDLIDTPWWPNDELNYGPHEITFKIMEQYGRQFLRFVSYLPA